MPLNRSTGGVASKFFRFHKPLFCNDYHAIPQTASPELSGNFRDENASSVGYAADGTAFCRKVLDKIPDRKSLTYCNSSIKSYTEKGLFDEAISLFKHMNFTQDPPPDRFTYINVVKACSYLSIVQQIQVLTVKIGYLSDVFLGSVIAEKYARFQKLDDMMRVFESLPYRDEFLWNTVIAEHAKNGDTCGTIGLFCRMQEEGLKANGFCFGNVIGVCAGLEESKQLHAQVLKVGLDSDAFVGGHLLNSYSKSTNTVLARKAFDGIRVPDIVNWTSLVTVYAENEQPEEAVKVLSQMRLMDVGVWTMHFFCLIRCGDLDSSWAVFSEIGEPDTVSWNAMLAAYLYTGNVFLAFPFFVKMQRMGMEMNQFTFASILEACAALKGLEDTKQVHARIIKTGLQMDASTTAGLINAYANCSEMADARLLFAKLPDQKLVSWNALMGGFVRNDQGEEAIKTFCKLHETGMVPNQSSFAIIVRASANLPSLEQGRQMHCLIIKTREDSDIFVGSSLVDMYAKCGNIDDARLVFDKMPERNVVSWNAIITGYAQHGHGSKVFHLFEEMQEEGLRPDEITFVGLLGACSHGGFVEKGHSFFESMQSDYNLKPGIEHYACMVDLLGRAGRLEEAENLIKRMPLEADSFIWQSFLGACRIHGNLQMGLSAAECLMKTHPENAATYVLLSHILAEGKRWSDVERVRKLMKERNVKKDPGCSWIELKGNVHSFVAWDVTHPNIKEIYAKLQELHRQISQAGYIPDTRFVLQDI